MKKTLLICALTLCLLLSACGSPKSAKTLTIAIQYGVAYAPLEWMKQEGLLERALPDVSIQWKQLGGPMPIREGMLAGEIDIGCMGVGPVLIGIDQGMPWRYCAALSANEVAFVVSDSNIHSLADLTFSQRIAVLSPGCTQHILLCMAAEQQLGNPLALENQLVSLSHPDAMTALLSGGEVVMHISCPPYTDMELESGMHTILTGEEVMGKPFTFISCVAMERFHDQQPALYDAFLACLNQAFEAINADLPAAAARLASVYGLSEDELLLQMSRGGTIYGGALSGVDELAAAMAEMGLIQEVPTRERYAFPDVRVEGRP
ncbi:MAG: ABC transporter substrate-binding protein [Clostridia bacterium]|nr:ABC transporter substrate-binding protein [Clostridia bacterium]